MNFLWFVAALIVVLALTYLAARRTQRRIQSPTSPRRYSSAATPTQAASAPIERIALSSSPARSVADQTRVHRRPVESPRSTDSRQDDSTALLMATTLAHTQGWAAPADEPRREDPTPAYEPREAAPVVSAIEDDSSRYRTTGGFGGGGYSSVADSFPSHSSSSSSDYSSSSSDYSSSNSDSSPSSFD